MKATPRQVWEYIIIALVLKLGSDYEGSLENKVLQPLN